MSQSNFSIPNEPGINFRQDLNIALQALATASSGSAAPTTTYPFQFWCDTSGATPILKYRNSANTSWIPFGDMSLDYLGLKGITYGSTAPTSPQPFQFWVDTSGSFPTLNQRDQANTAWIYVGRCDVQNFGLMPKDGGAFSGYVDFQTVEAIKVPVGNTSERPASTAQGMIRFNYELVAFEGFNGTYWSPIGGGGFVGYATQNISAGASVTNNLIDARQLRPVQGNSAPVSTSLTPFGSTGGWKDGSEICLVGMSDTNSVTITYNDAAKGAVGNFSTIELTKYKAVTFIYSSTLDRWLLQGGI